jgi:hypothetical protein
MSTFGGRMARYVALAFTAAVLAACSSSGDYGSTPPSVQPTGLSASDIRSILSGKSWKWQGPNNSGTTLYAADGSSLVEVTGKGTTKGTWSTKDGQLCESFSPAPFMPNGVPLTCYPFSGSGGVYQAGKATFTLAS